jgi:hypothetical protein
MITLPDGPRTATAVLIDKGLIQRSAGPGKTNRVNRKGSRYRLQVAMGPFYAEKARDFIADLVSGKSEGVQISYPLQWPQDGCGALQVDGAGQGGTSLNIKGGTPGFMVRKGFWLSLEDENGQHYLHNVKTPVRIGATGTAMLVITPELRHPFLNNATIHMARPMVQGFVDGDEWAWELSGDRATPIVFTLEEYA